VCWILVIFWTYVKYLLIILWLFHGFECSRCVVRRCRSWIRIFRGLFLACWSPSKAAVEYQPHSKLLTTASSQELTRNLSMRFVKWNCGSVDYDPWIAVCVLACICLSVCLSVCLSRTDSKFVDEVCQEIFACMLAYAYLSVVCTKKTQKTTCQKLMYEYVLQWILEVLLDFDYLDLRPPELLLYFVIRIIAYNLKTTDYIVIQFYVITYPAWLCKLNESWQLGIYDLDLWPDGSALVYAPPRYSLIIIFQLLIHFSLPFSGVNCYPCH